MQHTTPPLMPMTGEQRSHLRRAVVSKGFEWKSYRRANDLSMDSMSNAQLWAAAYALGIDAVSIVTGQAQDMEHHKPRPFSKGQVEALQVRLGHLSQDQLSPSQRQLVGAILLTIQNKQEGRATVKQYDTMDRIISKAELGFDQEASDKAAEAHETQTASNGHDTTKAAPQASNGVLNGAGDMAGQIGAAIAGVLGNMVNEARIGEIIDSKIKDALAGIPTVRLEVKGPDGQTRKLEGQHHPLFVTLLKMCTARKPDGHRLNIWMAGPAASGKTTAVKNVAEALGSRFGAIGSIADPAELLGYKDVRGRYHPTLFREIYENGGVFVCDDFDGSNPNATVSLNMAFDNGSCAFPDGMVQKHPDTVIIATANTWGGGATADYVGRNKMDGAFKNRFVDLAWDYDEAFERAICGNAPFAMRVQMARRRARDAGIKVLITPRASISGAALIAAGFTEDQAAEMTYLAGIKPADRTTIEGK